MSGYSSKSKAPGTAWPESATSLRKDTHANVRFTERRARVLLGDLVGETGTRARLPPVPAARPPLGLSAPDCARCLGADDVAALSSEEGEEEEEETASCCRCCWALSWAATAVCAACSCRPALNKLMMVEMHQNTSEMRSASNGMACRGKCTSVFRCAMVCDSCCCCCCCAPFLPVLRWRLLS